jgi:PIN domain nuclease of toxin-antitoxin system
VKGGSGVKRETGRRSGQLQSIWRAPDLANYDGALLLDTHIWIWYIDGDGSQLSEELVALLDRSGSTSRLLVSDVSYCEVAVKAARGKLSFSIDVAVWLRRAESAPGVRFLPLDRTVLFQSTRLPGAIHNDPADRMLIAAAQINNVPLVTADRAIIDYASAHPGIPVVDARVRG